MALVPHGIARLRGFMRSLSYSADPIIIGGCERSGTTLLLSILSAHPAIHALPHEVFAFCHGPRGGFKDSTRPIRMGRLYDYLAAHPKPATACRWCEKSPANVFFFSEILRHFRDRVRLLQIIRDGRDVVSSVNPQRPERPWTGPNRWVAAVTAGLNYRHHPQVFTLRYEDLVAATRTVLEGLYAFLKERATPEALDWHSNALMRHSENITGSVIEPIYARSVRKFDVPGFQYHERVDALMARPEAVKLLELYGYL